MVTVSRRAFETPTTAKRGAPKRMDKRPTARQLELMRHVQAYTAAHGFSPSRAALCELMSFASVNAAAFHTANLEEAGLVTRTVGCARSIIVTEAGLKALALADAEAAAVAAVAVGEG